LINKLLLFLFLLWMLTPSDYVLMEH
jgi:hypothetical protein